MHEIKNEAEFFTVINTIKQQIRPTSFELAKITTEINRLIEILTPPDPNHKYFPKELGPHGSTGIKQTQLKNDSDIDFFIGFEIDSKYIPQTFNWDQKLVIPLEDQKQFFNRISKEVIIPRLKEHNYSNISLSYAEHPYVSATRDGIQIDIVGYYCIPEYYLFEFGPVSAVDRTPYHSKYVVNNLTEDLRDDIRVMKYFMKRCQAYGEKSIIGRSGFIGYALELLMIHFGSLKKFCMYFDELEHNIIDPHKRPKEFFKKHPRYVNDFLFIMDPTDQYRNVGSSIDPVSFLYIKQKLHALLDNPDLKYFEPSIPDDFDVSGEPLETLKKYFILEVRDPEHSHFTKIRDKIASIGSKLEKLSHNKDLLVEFEGIRYETFCNEEEDRFSLMVYVENPLLTPTTNFKGPKISGKQEAIQNIERFKAKHGDKVKQMGNFLYAEVPRKIKDFSTYFDEIIKQYLDSDYQILEKGCLADIISKDGQISKNFKMLYFALSRIILNIKYA